MAKWFPNIETVKKAAVTDAEKNLIESLKFMKKECSIFYKPQGLSSNPDIVILHEQSGAFFVHFHHNSLDGVTFEEKNPSKKDSGILVYNTNPEVMYDSPIQSIRDSKNKFYEDELSNFLSKNQIKGVFGFVKTSVFFLNSTENQINETFDFAETTKVGGLIARDYFVRLWGVDTDIKRYLYGTFAQPLADFTQDFYNEMFKILNLCYPDTSNITSPQEMLILNKKQSALSESTSGKQQKVRGVAGCGKTTVLTRRAVNAYLRTKKPVLILTYNITICNYIQQQIKNFFPEYKESQFLILNIHKFINTKVAQSVSLRYQTQSYNTMIDGELNEKLNYLKKYGDFTNITQYSCILIDEVQDFHLSWLTFVKDFILAEDGEYVLFGDEKQNIYNRDLEDKRVITNVIGAWNEMTASFRLSNVFTKLAMEFQNYCMYEQYELDTISSEVSYSAETFTFLDWSMNNISDIPDFVQKKKNELGIEFKDIALLSGSINTLQQIEEHFQNDGIECTTMFQGKNDGNFSAMTREKKFRFDIDTEFIKLSTIHSFKGWELNTIIIYLGYSDISPELLYTALTRCKQHLIIIDQSEEKKYADFFANYLP